ncbi:OTU domain-containing protein 7B-like [Ptychodera flava]|uniref:OTU domain-containing protein 7B-like n=1 Tax=Ptychodera flava TaxID=63121 RepID=UPI003969D90B
MAHRSQEDDIFSDFVNETQADPGLARDLLEANHWNREKALADFNKLSWSKRQTPPKTRVAPSSKPTSLVSSGGMDKGTTAGVVTRRPVPLSTSEVSIGQSIPGGRKAVLERSVAVDEVAMPESPREKRLTRGISRANAPLIDMARTQVKVDEDNQTQLIDTPVYTFVLPDLSIYDDDFRAFLEKDLIEMAMLVTLEQAGRLNWWAQTGTCDRLWPMATTGDGNCLLHAASLGMWGFHDRLLTLRKVLFSMMSAGLKVAAFKRRWRHYQTQLNKESGLMYSESEWEQEWDNLLKLASINPRSRRKSTLQMSSSLSSVSEDPNAKTEEPEDENCTYESLEEFHVFVLAHVLRRPIIVVADTVLRDSNGEAFAPIPFGGIYLPLECKETECQRSPLVLTYDAAHFSALVAMESDTTAPDEDETKRPRVVIPLTDAERKLLPIHFAVDPGPQWNWQKDGENQDKLKRLKLSEDQKIDLLNRYLDVILVPVTFPDHVNSLKKETSEKMETGSNKSDENKSTNGSYDSLDKTNKGTTGKGAKQKAGAFATMKTKLFGGKKKNPRKKNSDSSDDGSSSGQSSVSGTVTDKPKDRKLQSCDDLRNENFIVAAKLSNKRQHIQQEMVENYLKTAEERHHREQEARRQQGNGQRRLGNAKPTKCISPKCDMYATADTNYLCSSCYAKHKRAAEYTTPGRSNSYNPPYEGTKGTSGTNLDVQKPLEKRFSAPSNVVSGEINSQRSPVDNYISTLPAGTKSNGSNAVTDVQGGPIPHRNPAVHTRKSNMPEMDEIEVLNDEDDLNPAVMDQVQFRSQPQASYARDTGNLTGNPAYKGVTTSKITMRSVPKPCKAPSCQFYGTEETDFYCSACFRERKRTRAMMFSYKS